MNAPKLYIVACEASGDMHAAHLISELKKLAPAVEIRGTGGPSMASQGITVDYDMTTISSLGLGDVIRQYGTYRKIFHDTIRHIEEWNPDAVIVLDSPAFNLRLAKKISAKFPVIYYISPQIWAWGMRRIHVIRKHISKMLCILPFEVEMYDKAGVPSLFVGHPLLDQVPEFHGREKDPFRRETGIPEGATAVGLLAGSRAKEVKRIFPIMLESAKLLHERMPDIRFYYSKSKNIDQSLYDECLKDYKDLPIEISKTDYHTLIKAMDFCLVTSGTATLETTLIGTPFFLLYKASLSTYILGRMLIRVKYLGLANLLVNRPVVPEFIQQHARPRTIAHEAEVLLKNRLLYEQMQKDFHEIRERLGHAGGSRCAAQAVLDFLKK